MAPNTSVPSAARDNDQDEERRLEREFAVFREDTVRSRSAIEPLLGVVESVGGHSDRFCAGARGAHAMRRAARGAAREQPARDVLCVPG